MSTEERLKISSPQADGNATGTLKIEVALEPSGTTEDARDPIQIELVLDRAVIPADLVRAAENAASNAKGRSDVSQWVTLEGAGNWKAWARPFGDEPKSFTLWISNDRNENQEQVDQAQRGTVPLSIEIPLRDDLEEKKKFTEVQHRYATTYRSKHRRIFDFGATSNFELCVLAKNEAPPAKRPLVRLYTPTEGPNALRLGETLDIRWKVEDGVSGKLIGPFADETRVLTLAAKSGETPADQLVEKGGKKKKQYLLAEDAITVMALGTQIYELEATVALEENENTVVRRRLIVDVVTADDYAALKLVPSVVLPHGRIKASWYVCGVNHAKIDIQRDSSRERISIEVMKKHDDSADHAQGEYWFDAAPKGTKVGVRLFGEGPSRYEVKTTYEVRSWDDIDVSLQQSPGCRDLAYAQRGEKGVLAVCVGKCLHYKEVGIADSGESSKKIDWSTFDGSKNGVLACAGFAGGFALVHQHENGSFRLATDFPDGPQGWAPPVPKFLGSCLLAGLPVQVCVLEGRAYVIVRTQHAGFAWSFPISEPTSGSEKVFQMGGEWCEEPLLNAMAAYTLCVCDGALYALDRETGHLYRLEPGKDPSKGTLMAPKVCAPAVDDKGASLVKTGACVAIERLLAVVGSHNVQDIVYNPEWNVWNRCGRHHEDALAAAFRRGDPCGCGLSIPIPSRVTSCCSGPCRCPASRCSIPTVRTTSATL